MLRIENDSISFERSCDRRINKSVDINLFKYFSYFNILAKFSILALLIQSLIIQSTKLNTLVSVSFNHLDQSTVLCNLNYASCACCADIVQSWRFTSWETTKWP